MKDSDWSTRFASWSNQHTSCCRERSAEPEDGPIPLAAMHCRYILDGAECTRSRFLVEERSLAQSNGLTVQGPSRTWETTCRTTTATTTEGVGLIVKHKTTGQEPRERAGMSIEHCYSAQRDIWNG